MTVGHLDDFKKELGARVTSVELSLKAVELSVKAVEHSVKAVENSIKALAHRMDERFVKGV